MRAVLVLGGEVNVILNLPLNAGADDFTPVLIYVTIKAQPEHFASNLAFIERYRTSSRLVSADQYFFVQMVRENSWLMV